MLYCTDYKVALLCILLRVLACSPWTSLHDKENSPIIISFAAVDVISSYNNIDLSWPPSHCTRPCGSVLIYATINIQFIGWYCPASQSVIANRISFHLCILIYLSPHNATLLRIFCA